MLLTYYNPDKCLGTYGVNKIQNRAELQQSIKGQQSLGKRRKDDALWKPQCGKHGMTRDKTRNPIKQDKRQRSINKPYEFYLLSEWFSFKFTLCESRMKVCRVKRKRPAGGLPAGERAGSALTFTPTRKNRHTERNHQETYTFQERQGKISVNSAQEKNIPGVTSSSSCLVGLQDV